MPASREQRAATAARRAQNLSMRLAGIGWDQIAEKLKYSSKAAACKDFLRAMEAAEASSTESATLLKKMQRLRLERLTAAFWPGMMKGDAKAGRMVLDTLRERSRLDDLTGAQKTIDNAVDAWLDHVTGGGDLHPEDAAALAAVTAVTATAGADTAPTG